MATYEEAIDFMYATFKTVWEASAPSGAAAIAGYTPEVHYEGIQSNVHAPVDKYWARLSVRNALERQATLGSAHGAGTYEYESVGTLSIQLFLPKNDNAAIVIGRRLAQLARNAYRGVASGDEVWYTNATISEQPPDERWSQINVTVTYRFMETL